jgi:hypothetical protein
VDSQVTLGDILEVENEEVATRILCSVSRLLFRDWFYRTWIIQEYVLSGRENTKFYCGSSQLVLHELKTFAELDMGEQMSYAAAGLSFASAWAMSGDSRLFTIGRGRLIELEKGGRAPFAAFKHQNWKNSLLWWLTSSRDAKSSDARDKCTHYLLWWMKIASA